MLRRQAGGLVSESFEESKSWGPKGSATNTISQDNNSEEFAPESNGTSDPIATLFEIRLDANGATIQPKLLWKNQYRLDPGGCEFLKERAQGRRARGVVDLLWRGKVRFDAAKTRFSRWSSNNQIVTDRAGIFRNQVWQQLLESSVWLPTGGGPFGKIRQMVPKYSRLCP